ncbi:MAG: FGGY-family carbohydrate kinase [Candidatus Binataceae bacterium]
MASSSDKYVLAIDMGTGSVKAALVSEHGEVVSSALRSIHTVMLPGGGAEQDPEEWWSAVVAAASAAVTEAALPADRIIAVACTGQWAVTVAVDEGGAALGNAISWMDSRGAPYNRAIVGGWPRLKGYSLFKLMKWIRFTGGAPMLSGFDGLGHILYLKHRCPELYARAYKFLEPMDYLNLRLTGRCAASYGTLFPYWLTDNRDPNRVDYVPELIRMAGVDRTKLPDLMPVDSVLGTLKPAVAQELGLSPATRVVMGSFDGHSAAVGAGAVRDYDGYFYVGTTAWMSCHVPVKKTDLLHLISTMPAAIAGRYVVTAEQGMAGRCLEFLKDLLFPPGDPEVQAPADPYGYLNRAAARIAPGSDGLIFTPWINGVLAPHEEFSTRSAFFNQTARTTQGHYARAVMEGIAFNLRWLKRHVEKFIGRRFEHLAFIGGAAQSELWCQIMADVLECPVRQVENPRNANAVGAAMAAFAALGEVAVGDIPSIVKIAALYHPLAVNRRIYDDQFRAFMEFNRRTRSIYRRLNPVGS